MDEELLDEIREIVRYDITSNNEEDQWQQQELFVKLYNSVQSVDEYSEYAHWSNFCTRG